ncbi:hypothetical protein LTR99_002333 [Exophiala xenobiotica]|uniref:N-acetyltransferase domain-containing protein n=1 Tax=Vermiconidia calcicola TaxID=1690605 RepID=A0AAV9QK50_9PEZI|nr:hypothetical protein LTR96_002569 [Exophiala xenobiotica]KAK5542330.1 hypothetical protein LTR25_002215 [Vermiconidia calcicola]KAK5546188.1 hypothetical protein LTR23_003639 [Chaetothyriales sp. CCFEE 6169]KAK5306641.1 hypothetical protein LTR99_002333 [Exophiala xenobiotica]KAK5341381.1 hypothetical protein LTR98_002173 [Exophiala xenobiotica]
MHVRPAKPQDLPDCATIARDAMFDDGLTVYLAPHRHTHPECLRQGVLRRAKKKYYDGHTTLVAVTDQDDAQWNGTEKVVGYLSAGSSTQNEQNTPQLFSRNAFELQLLRLEELFIWYTNSDRSISRAKWLEYWRSIASGTRGPLADIKEYWEVDHLPVAPAYHRRGIGSALVEYVQRIASNDNLPVVLFASVKGRPMYKRAEFLELGPATLGTGYVSEAMVWYPNGSASSKRLE